MGKKTKNIYFIGIAGVGMSALAVFAKQLGHNVSGSDNAEEYLTDKVLKKAKIQRIFGFDEKNISKKFDLIIQGAAYNEKNPEIKIAKKLHLNTKYYSEAIQDLTSNFRTIAVSGVHGKTTTSAMIAFLFEKAKLSPNYIIGSSQIPGLPSNANVGGGDWFIVEADEYKKSQTDNTPKFMDLKPEILLINAIEWDHPDMYDSVDQVYSMFYKLACKMKRGGVIIANIDSQKVLKLYHSLADRKFITYGFNRNADWQIVKWKEDKLKTEFYLKNAEQEIGPFFISVSGKHNVYNAVACILAGHEVGIKFDTCAKYLSDFKGVERRFQYKGKKNNVIVIDDYAHHPTAINLTLETIRSKYSGKKIICIFQPHTFSRTKALLNDFAKSFKNADEVIITDIFASAREKSGGIHSRHLVFEIKKYHKNVLYIPKFQEIEEYLKENVAKDYIVLTMGAGDVYKIGDNFLANQDESIQT